MPLTPVWPSIERHFPFYPKDAIPETRPVDQITTLAKPLSEQPSKNIEKKDGKFPGEKILKIFEENRSQLQTNLLENICIRTTNSTSAKVPNTSINNMLHYRYCNNAATEPELEYQMTFRQPYQDPRSERLLLVALEEKQYHGSEYRHIRATVVRRAVPHKMAPKIDSSENCVAEWNDDYEAKCSGYRVASYVFPTASTNIYVDDLQLRGQIDAMPRPLRNGRPYGNSIRFTPHQVDANSAEAIGSFYKKFGKFVDKYNLTRQNDDFYVALNHLAQFLKITRVLFYKPHVTHAALSDTGMFEETDIAFASVRINEMLAPFAQDETV